jgi:hypothetical protein
MEILGERVTSFSSRNVSVNYVSGIRVIISNICFVLIRFSSMRIANRKWSKGKWYNIMQSQIDYLLG